jgi:hypothetical protein
MVIGLNALVFREVFFDPRPSPSPTTPDAGLWEVDESTDGSPPDPCSFDGLKCPSAATPKLDPNIPVSLTCTNQGGAICSAWQHFIALNWPASPQRGQPDVMAPPSKLGAPGTAGAFPAVVWQTYKEQSEVFLPGAAKPPPWNSSPAPENCTTPGGGQGRGRSDRPQAFIPQVAELRLVPNFGSGSSVQPGDPRNWIADTSGNLVWYQILLNQTEFDEIVNRGLYNAASQAAVSQQGKAGVHPPRDSLELKAAWRQIVDPNLYGRYLMSDACIPGPGGMPRPAQIGLVGLHIIHKLDNQPNWLWATFEHVDNAPDAAEVQDAGSPRDASYSFYSRSCTAGATPIPAACFPDASADAGPIYRSCTPNTRPAYDLSAYFDGGSDMCEPYPIQVVRETSIPDQRGNRVQRANRIVREMIVKANSRSVLQYYQLVSAMWWTTSTGDHMDGGAPVPLSTTGLQPQDRCKNNQSGCVANTTLETYRQDTNCLTCHVDAGIATVNGGGTCGGAACAADYSFVFSAAELPDGGAGVVSDSARKSGRGGALGK